MTWSVCSYTNDYLPTHHHHPHSPPGNRNPLVFLALVTNQPKNAEHASQLPPPARSPPSSTSASRIPLVLLLFLKSKCLTLTVNASLHQHCMSRPGLLNLDCLMHPPIPSGSVLFSPNPPDSPPPLIPTVSSSGFYWVSELRFSVGVGLCLQRKGWVCPQAAPPLGQAGWLGSDAFLTHSPVLRAPALSAPPVPVQLHGAPGPRKSPPVPHPVPAQAHELFGLEDQ